MRLDLPGQPQLTYCTNIHAGETWDEIRTSLDAQVPRIKARICPDAPFGLGLRLSGLAAAELVQERPLALFKEQLARLGCTVFTLNAFPYGPFHGTRVKEQVYEPDWRSERRVSFTSDAAAILAALLPEGGHGSISTVPGGFKSLRREAGAVEALSEHLLQAAAHLVQLERRSGRVIALALEPEPCCFLETTEETLAFFEGELLSAAALSRFAALAGLTRAQAEPALRRHLGVCYDVCHGAVEFEDPVAALKRLRAAGVAIPKIQLSAAQRVPVMTAALVARLRGFDTGVYLHQVVVRDGGLTRFRDLPDALAAFAAGGARGEWRIHCHVPVFLGDLGDLASTQEALVATLRALRAEAFSRHLEAETYTWDILPERLKSASKADDIARELAFILTELQHERRDQPADSARRHAAPAGAGF
jgi:sugar phosphate isomerase/epimerase